MSYIATVNWETLIDTVTLDAVTHYYRCNIPPKNLSDSGAGTIVAGYYIVDYLGYIYEIKSSVYYTNTNFTGSGLDDLTTGGTYTYISELDYKIEIDGTGTPDTFRWSDDGGST